MQRSSFGLNLEKCKKENEVPIQDRVRAFVYANDEDQLVYLIEPEFFYSHARIQKDREQLGLYILELENLRVARRNGEEIILGLGYEKGIGVVKDEKKAMECYTTAYKRRSVVAGFMLARMYNAQGKNDEFLQHLQEASNQELAAAMYMLADIYLYGKSGVLRNGRQGLKLLQCAAIQNYPQACMDLGRLLFNADDPERACYQFKKCAEAGNYKALERLKFKIEDPSFFEFKFHQAVCGNNKVLLKKLAAEKKPFQAQFFKMNDWEMNVVLLDTKARQEIFKAFMQTVTPLIPLPVGVTKLIVLYCAQFEMLRPVNDSKPQQHPSTQELSAISVNKMIRNP